MFREAHPETFIPAYRARYERATGRRFEQFLCPFTMEDTFGRDDAKTHGGHILPKSLRERREVLVPQRGDLDNFYGERLEHIFIERFNTPHMQEAERFLRKGPRQHFAYNPHNAAERYPIKPLPPTLRKLPKHHPVLAVRDDGGNLVGYRMVECDFATMDRLTEGGFLDVFTSVPIDHPAVEAVLLRSACLAMFKMLDARFVLDQTSLLVRNPIGRFFSDRAASDDVGQYFGHLRGAVTELVGPMRVNMPDTLQDDVLLMHVRSGHPFASSCVFRLNGLMIGVALPFDPSGGDPASIRTSIALYGAMIAQDGFEFDTHFGRIIAGNWHVTPEGLPRVSLEESMEAERRLGHHAPPVEYATM